MVKGVLEGCDNERKIFAVVFATMTAFRKVANHPLMALPPAHLHYTDREDNADRDGYDYATDKTEFNFHPDKAGKAPRFWAVNDQTPAGIVASSTKFQAVRALCRKWRTEGKKFLIFSQSTRMLDLLERAVFGPG